MTVVNPKSISGINSITTGSGSDNLLTIHTSDASSTERVRINSSGDVIVGSGITASPDGNIFSTGITTIRYTGTSQYGLDVHNPTSGGSGARIRAGDNDSQYALLVEDGGGTNLFEVLAGGGGARLRSGDLSILDKIAHYGDGNTFIRFPAADTITAETGGSERVRVGSGGDVSIGGHATNYADSPLEVRGTNAGGDVAIRVTNNSTDAGSQAGVIFTTTTSDYTTAGIAYERGGTADALRFYVGQSSGAGGFDNATERLRIDTSGRIGIQGAPTKALLDVRASGGSATMLTAVFGANEGTTAGTLSDNTDKACRIGSYHYDIDEEPFGIITASGTNGTNNLTLGGGTSLMNAATEIKFNTAANSTTTSGTNRLTIDSSGNITVNTGNIVIGTSGKGIDFSADGNATGNTSELLHDYEEGTWSATSFNYDYDGNQAQRGHYIKVGRVVHAFFRLKFSTQSTYTGQHMRFTGLPFAAASGNPYDLNVGGIAHGYGSEDFFRVYVSPGTAYAYWYTSTGSNYNNSTSLNNADIRGCITYTASA